MPWCSLEAQAQTGRIGTCPSTAPVTASCMSQTGGIVSSASGLSAPAAIAIAVVAVVCAVVIVALVAVRRRRRGTVALFVETIDYI